jgi:stearoyl-CoA desaturase (delta-9 desaturase)
MHAWIAIFLGVNVRKWAAVHRYHHAHTDSANDPHSPHYKGYLKVFFGSFFYFNVAGSNIDFVREQTPDYVPDLVDKIPWLGYRGLAGAIILCALFGFWGLWLVFLHLTGYLVLFGLLNTLGHSSPYSANSKAGRAANVTWLSWLTAGESLHKNHHSNPSAAKFSIHERESDPGWWLIWLLTKLHLAKL